MVYLPTFYHKNQPNVGVYTIPMDPMGHYTLEKFHILNDSKSWRRRVQFFFLFNWTGGCVGEPAVNIFQGLFPTIQIQINNF